jgi:hydroxymethylglutaryl-CoA synthase
VNPNIKNLTPEQSYTDKELQKVFTEISTSDYNTKVEPSALLPKNLGNSYTASMYTGLISLISQKKDELVNFVSLDMI